MDGLEADNRTSIIEFFQKKKVIKENGCVLTSVFDLIFRKSLSVQNINQRINRIPAQLTVDAFDYLETSESQCRGVSRGDAASVR